MPVVAIWVMKMYKGGQEGTFPGGWRAAVIWL